MHRSPQEVAKTHLDAVVAGDPIAMAADYAADAVLVRQDESYHGHAAIAAYFATVPERLGPARVIFDSVEFNANQVTFSWHIEGAAGDASGTDVCQISDGKITHQVVNLDNTDF